MKTTNPNTVTLKRISQSLAVLVIITGAFVLIGWQFNFEFLIKPLSTLKAMNPAAAVGFILSGISLLLLPHNYEKNKLGGISKLAAVGLALIGLSRFVEVIAGINLGADQWLFGSKLYNNLNGTTWNHMAASAAFNFMLLGAVLLLTNSQHAFTKYFINACIAILLTTGLFSFLCYVYRVNEYQAPIGYITISIHSAICFVLIGASLFFAHGNPGFIQTYTSDSRQGKMVRWLIPVMVLAPVALGYAGLWVFWEKPFSLELGGAALITGMVIFLFGSTWYLATVLNKSNDARDNVEEQLKQLNQHLEEKVIERTEKLKTSEKHYKSALDGMLEGATIIDFNWNYVYVNDAAVRIGQITREQLLGQNISQRFIRSENPELFKVLEECMTMRTAHSLETQLTFKNGAKGDFMLRIQPVPQGVFILSMNVTERKKAKERLEKANRLYAFISAINQAIVHNTSQQPLFDKVCSIATEIGQFKLASIILLDKEFERLNIVSAQGNENIVKVLKQLSDLNYTSTLLAATPIGRALKTEHYAVSNDVLNDPGMATWKDSLVQNGTNSIITLPIKKFGQTVGIFGLQSGVVNFFDDDEITLLEEAALDISFALENFEKEKLRKQAAALVIQNEARLKRAQHLGHIGHWELDFETGNALWSEEACRIYGFDPSNNEHSFNEWLQYLHPGDKDFVLGKINDSKKTLSNNEFDHRIVWPDGTVRHIHSEAQFELDATGKPTGLYGLAHDITEQKNWEEKLRRNESKLKDAQDIAGIGSWEIDFVNNTLHWSDGQFHLLGYEPGEVSPSSELFLSMVHPDDSPAVNKSYAYNMGSLISSSMEFRLVKRDGAVRNFYCQWQFEFDNNQKPIRIYGIVQDITERKHMEAQQALFASIVSSSDDAIISKTLTGIITSWNHGAEKTLGYTAEEIIGKHISVLIPKEIQSEETIILQKTYKGEGIEQYETERLRKDGSLVYVSLTISPIKDTLGNTTGASKIMHDITQRKLAENEIKELNENLEQKVIERTHELIETNKALESFSYSVSHDLRAPVRTIMGFSKIINNTYAQQFSPDLKELMGHIESSGKRMNAIIDDMLMLAKFEKEKLRPVSVDMTRLFRHVWNNISAGTAHHATLQLAELPKVEADVWMLEQVVVNLLSNAIKYSSKKENPVVIVDFKRSDTGVTFFVKDNGAGFDMENYNKLFVAFHRLHGANEFEGTGVGLTLVKRIVEKHGGIVWAEAKVDEGAAFYFTMPGSN